MSKKEIIISKIKEIKNYLENINYKICEKDEFISYLDLENYDLVDVLTLIDMELMEYYPNQYDYPLKKYKINLNEMDKEILFLKIDDLIELMKRPIMLVKK